MDRAVGLTGDYPLPEAGFPDDLIVKTVGLAQLRRNGQLDVQDFSSTGRGHVFRSTDRSPAAVDPLGHPMRQKLM